MRARTAGQDGLTVLEAVAVLVLLAVLLAAAAPQMFPGIAAVHGAARELAADMALARQLAVSRGTPYVVEFRPSGGPYTSYTVRADGGPDEPGFPKEFPTGVSAQGSGAVRFLPSGATDLPSPWVDWELRAGPESLRVRVWAQTGYARVLR